MFVLFLCAIIGCQRPDSDDTPAPPAPRPTSDDDDGPVDTAQLPDDAPDVLPTFPELVSPGRGRYTEPVDVTFGAPWPGVSLRFTTDARDPAAHGELAPPTLRVDRTTVLRVAWVAADGRTLAHEAHTFLFAAQISAQSAPADYPSTWWVDDPLGPFPADYAVDPEVVDDPRNAGVFPAVFDQYPVLSISLDPDDLFGPSGIHENPLSEGILWERAATLEWLDDVDPAAHHGLGAGLRIQGGSSRDPAKSAKKSFRVSFKDDYGPSSWEHDAFAAPTAVRSFDTVVLRARYNRSWTHFDAGQRERALFLREQMGADLQRAIGGTSGHTRPVHLLLNGLYWVLYLMQERPDEHFASAYLGGSSDDWDILNTGVVTAGDRVAWEAMIDAVDADLDAAGAYEEAVAHLELHDFVDYTLLNLFLGNVDWPDRNWYAGRSRLGGGWRFFNWDTELIMTSTTANQLPLIDFPDSPGHIFTRLTAHPSFRRTVGDRAHRLFFDDGPLTPAPLGARWADLADTVVPGVIAESARWGDHVRDDRLDPTGELYTFQDHWQPEYDDSVRVYWPARTPIFVEHLRAAGLYPLIEAPTGAPADGPWTAPIGLTCASGEGWLTLDGADPAAPDDQPAPVARPFVVPIAPSPPASLRARCRGADGAWSALVARELL
jgi:hypothetical protein